MIIRPFPFFSRIVLFTQTFVVLMRNVFIGDVPSYQSFIVYFIVLNLIFGFKRLFAKFYFIIVDQCRQFQNTTSCDLYLSQSLNLSAFRLEYGFQVQVLGQGLSNEYLSFLTTLRFLIKDLMKIRKLLEKQLNKLDSLKKSQSLSAAYGVYIGQSFVNGFTKDRRIKWLKSFSQLFEIVQPCGFLVMKAFSKALTHELFIVENQ